MDSAQARSNKRSMYGPMLVTAGIVVVADQILKTVMQQVLSDAPIEIIEGAVTLRLTFNSGGAFGLLPSIPWFFLAASTLVVTLILLWARNLDDRRLMVPLGLVLGGGIGNLIDRIVRDTPGVIDFVDLHIWPVFNLADACISIGVVALLWLSFTSERADSRGAGAPRADGSS